MNEMLIPMAQDLEQLARELWTIGDITRLRILQLLPHGPDCREGTHVSGIAERLGLSQPTISNHLARLRTLGLVRHTRMCRDVYYYIDREAGEAVIEHLRQALLPPEEQAAATRPSENLSVT
ncbi:MAG: ArsR/SmtB family transcription factor [Opitutales bacterium]